MSGHHEKKTMSIGRVYYLCILVYDSKEGVTKYLL